jgi:hypothetical protein
MQKSEKNWLVFKEKWPLFVLALIVYWSGLMPTLLLLTNYNEARTESNVARAEALLEAQPVMDEKTLQKMEDELENSYFWIPGETKWGNLCEKETFIIVIEGKQVEQQRDTWCRINSQLALELLAEIKPDMAKQEKLSILDFCIKTYPQNLELPPESAEDTIDASPQCNLAVAEANW